MTLYRVEVWWRHPDGPSRARPDEGYLAHTVKREPWGVYLNHSDYEAMLPWHSLARVHVTEVETTA